MVDLHGTAGISNIHQQAFAIADISIEQKAVLLIQKADGTQAMTGGMDDLHMAPAKVKYMTILYRKPCHRAIFLN